MPESFSDLIKGNLSKVREKLGKAGFLPEIQPKIPLEEISEQTVSKTIISYLGNPLLQKLKNDRWANPFSIITVLENMGYHPFLFRGEDYYQAIKSEYLATRRALTCLVQQKALRSIVLEEPDENNERLYYQVADEEGLRRNLQRKNRKL